MAEIGFMIGGGELARVDEEDYGRVAKHAWRGKLFGENIIPVARIDGREVRLNRFIMGCTPGDGLLIEPKDGNYLNCTKSNLRKRKSPMNPTKSWAGRQNRAKLLPEVHRPAPNRRRSGCSHPVLVDRDQNGVYSCVHCYAPFSVTVDLGS